MKKMQKRAPAIRNFKSEVEHIVISKTKHDKWIKEGRMTEVEAAEEMEPEMVEVERAIKAVPPLFNVCQTT